jgi:hypothetical protein
MPLISLLIYCKGDYNTVLKTVLLISINLLMCKQYIRTLFNRFDPLF